MRRGGPDNATVAVRRIDQGNGVGAAHAGAAEQVVERRPPAGQRLGGRLPQRLAGGVERPRACVVLRVRLAGNHGCLIALMVRS